MTDQRFHRTLGLGLCVLSLALVTGSASADAYDPPAGYYDSATGTGATLKNQLSQIMSSGHIQRSYGQFRFSAATTDQDPDNANNILLVYNRASVDGTWNLNGTLPWNREHVWPQSRQPGSASNSSTGNLGDPHALRPANTQINSNRGNDPFGFADTTGSFGAVGSSWYPGDADRGDIARSLFYSATRYSSSGLTLVNGTPTGNQMGDLDSLIAWHYLDTPDDFERRRNHVIYSQAENPSYYTNNRNAFVDRPEFVHAVYVDNANDTQLTLAGGGAGADGASTLDLDFGKVIVGAALPAAQTVTLDKAGLDGTYYEVSTNSADVTSSVTGRYNAFAVGGTGSTTLDIGLSGSTALAGTLGGAVTIDNLDVTTGGGNGFGDQDGNDVINASLDVVDHSNASFAQLSNLDSLTLDFGTVTQGTAGVSLGFDLFNFAPGGALTADLDLDSILPGPGDSGVLTTDLTPGTSITAGASAGFNAFLDTAAAGEFSISYGLFTSDEDIPGATDGELIVLTLLAEVVANVLTGDYNADGFVSQSDLDLVLLNWGDAVAPAGFDEDAIPGGGPFDGLVSQNELDGVLLNWGNGTPPGAITIPEPASFVTLGLIGLVGKRRRRF